MHEKEEIIVAAAPSDTDKLEAKTVEQQERAFPSVIVPFSLKIEVLDRMLNFEITDDLVYCGFETQGFDDEEHGHGMLVFLQRRKTNITDVYYESGLNLNPKLYAVGGGLGVWTEHSFEIISLKFILKQENRCRSEVY
jgi:hypothetical protein